MADRDSTKDTSKEEVACCGFLPIFLSPTLFHLQTTVERTIAAFELLFLLHYEQFTAASVQRNLVESYK
ncbi:hypothetical protein L6164_006264 [Bauhinia variegata]|uniref:Uncharacterized protein n=1 Tax=Bauhinia variegata TaxID=167791 RepID=A0ACB9PTZ5_BAUVA|nr:hypothetical protein L6164_006264 [Bauhinia variegata]